MLSALHSLREHHPGRQHIGLLLLCCDAQHLHHASPGKAVESLLHWLMMLLCCRAQLCSTPTGRSELCWSVTLAAWLQGTALHALQSFLTTLAASGVPAASFARLMPALQAAGREPAISKAAQLNIASCMAVLCGGAAYKDVAATVSGLLQGAAGKDESTARLSLFSLGAIGRSMDLSKQGKLQVGSRCCTRESSGVPSNACACQRTVFCQALAPAALTRVATVVNLHARSCTWLKLPRPQLLTCSRCTACMQALLTLSLASPSEEVKGAAAFALGGVTIGAMGTYLPFVLQQIQKQVGWGCHACTQVATVARLSCWCRKLWLELLRALQHLRQAGCCAGATSTGRSGSCTCHLQAGNPKEQYLLLRALNETIVSLASAQAGASAAQLTPDLQDQVGCL